MKEYIKITLLGLGLTLGFTLPIAAQDDFEDEMEEATVAKKVVKKKEYKTRAVRGQVIDAATSAPIPGAMIKAYGVDGYSGLTDDQGNYTINVPVFTSSLYVSEPDYNAVVLGLTKEEQQKTVMLHKNFFKSDYKESTDILQTAQANNFEYTNAVNIKEEIHGQLGGYVYSTSRNGTPGIGATTFIQGLNSLNANAQPLVIVDGVILDQQYDNTMLHSGFFNDVLSNISTADIESVEVIRNATALYGMRGANGVIEIKTKRSKTMATRITASLSAGVTFQPKYYPMMDAEEYRSYVSDMLGTTNTKMTEFKFLNTDPNYYYYNQYHNNTDWKDKVYHSAMTQNYGINVSGGDDVAQYNLSVGYIDSKSPLKYNDMNRLNIRFNSDIALTHKFDVRFDASFSNLKRSIRDDGAPATYSEGTPTSPSFLSYVKSPFMSPYSYGNGKLSDEVLDVEEESYLSEALSSYKNYNWKLGNPWALNDYADGEVKNHFENSLFNIAITPKFKFNDKLALSEHFSYTLVNTNESYYVPVLGVPSYYVASVAGTRNNEVRSLATKHNSIYSDTRLTWKNRYDAHSVGVFGGMRLSFDEYTRRTQLVYNTNSDKTPQINNGTMDRTAVGADNSWRNWDWYVQGDYNYKGKYFVQANVTASASSRVGDEAKKGGVVFGKALWGLFPSLQAAWVITNEPWMASIKHLDYLKLSAGFDMSGNDNINNFAKKSYFSSNLYLNSVSALAFNGIGNDAIKWETTTRWNIGIDAGLLDNRLRVGVNFFTSITRDLLSLQTLGVLSGIENYWTNNGKLQNRGYDVSAVGKIVSSKDWQWEAGFSMGHYINKIKDLGGIEYIDNTLYGATIRSKVGSVANAFYGYQTNGVYSNSSEAKAANLKVLGTDGTTYYDVAAGDMRFVDQNGDGKINNDDMVQIGNPNPDVYGNIYTSVTWKRFRLDMNFNYSIGNDIYNYMRSQLEGGSRFMNQTTALNARWSVENDVTNVPRVDFQDSKGNSRFSDRWIEDGSYLKMKTLTLSYTLPMSSSFIQGLQFWIQGNNLLVISKYLGSDPEVSATNAVIGQGIDVGNIGTSRSIVAGVKINL